MKTALGVVLYHPKPNEMEHIKAMGECFEEMFVFDNSSEDHKNYFMGELYFTNKKNMGLPYAYNKFIKLSQKKNIDFLCIMDQDSIFEKKEIWKLKQFLSENKEQLKRTAIIAPRSYHEISKEVKTEAEITKANFVINSGSFLNISCLQREGLFYDETIFLDSVDFDFCLSVQERNLNIIVYEGSILRQNLGYVRKISIFKYCCHPAIRYYYLVRDRMYTNIKHFGKIKGSLISYAKNVNCILLILLYEDNKIEKMKSCFKGFVDYYKRKRLVRLGFEERND